MKKILFVVLTVAILLTVSARSEALLGIGKALQGLIKAEFSLMKAQVDKVEANLNATMNNMLQIQTQIQADMKANANAVMALKSEIKNTNQSAGGDIVTNDASLMKTSIREWKAICLALIGVIVGMVKRQSRLMRDIMFWQSERLSVASPEEKDALFEKRRKIVKKKKKKEKDNV